jgi:hypothetical protein
MRALVFALFMLLAGSVFADDPRYCGDAQRDARGKIKRSAAMVRAFKTEHACPVTLRHFGPCGGWAVDHVIPLACGGCDNIGNMQWLPNAIKSSSATVSKDRWERRVYCKAKS